MGLTWSLTLPQVAATLAATTPRTGRGVPVITHEVLNAVLVLVVLTSIGGPLLRQRYCRGIASADTGTPQAASSPAMLEPAAAGPSEARAAALLPGANTPPT